MINEKGDDQQVVPFFYAYCERHSEILPESERFQHGHPVVEAQP